MIKTNTCTRTLMVNVLKTYAWFRMPTLYECLGRQLRQMVADEKAEETRRNATLRSAPVHSLRRQRLDLGFARDRKKKRDLIEWIRRDNEVPIHTIIFIRNPSTDHFANSISSTRS